MAEVTPEQEAQFNESVKLIDGRLDKCDSLSSEISVNLSDLSNDATEEKEKVYLRELIELNNTCSELNSKIRTIVPRMPSGASGCPYMDAFLMWSADLLDIAELIWEALKFIWDAIKHLAHAIKHTVCAAIEGVKGFIHAMNSKKAAADGVSLHAEAASLSAQVVSALEESAAAEAGPPPMPALAAALSGEAGVIQTQALEVAEEAGWADDEAAAWADAMREDTKHAEEHITQAGHHFVECGKSILACAKHIAFGLLKGRHAAQVTGWQAAVIAVEAVPEFPLPICGWDIENPYEWNAGDIASEIGEELLQIVEPQLNVPTPIIQGVNTVQKINGFIENELYEIPKMEFLGGGSIF